MLYLDPGDASRMKQHGTSQKRRGSAPAWWAALPLAPAFVGGLWLWLAAQAGLAGVLLGAVPGGLLLATGISGLLWGADGRFLQFMVLGAALGVAASVPALLVFGIVGGAILLAGSGASLLAAGHISAGQEPPPSGVPAPRVDHRLALRVASDEFSMCAISLTTWPLTFGGQANRVRAELDKALELFGDRGWLEQPETYHRPPPPLVKPELVERNASGQSFEHVSFESAYEPWPEEPGRERWLSHERNRTAHAWMIRHTGEPRPWLVCLHGIRMGSPQSKFALFRLRYLHLKLGLNVLLPVLPIHGPRRAGLVSGDRILSGDVMDMIHAGAQAVWEARRLAAWLREEHDAPAVGVIGNSLGGYPAALLPAFDAELDCAILGSPAVSPTRLFWRIAPSLTTGSLRASGVREDDMERLFRVVSPLAFEPRVPKERLGVFSGSADRVVPATEAHSLWMHWGEPRIAWYEGIHRDFLRAPEGREILESTLRAAGMLSGKEWEDRQ